MPSGKVVKVDETVYGKAKRIAAETGVTLGEAVLEVGAERGPNIPKCTEVGFRTELRLAGVEAPPKLAWLFGVLDNLPAEMVEGTALEVYHKAKAVAEANCQLLAASLENLENGLAENASAAVAENDQAVAENDQAVATENDQVVATENEQADAEALPEVPSPQEGAVRLG